MIRAVDTDELPVLLPEMEDFKPTGRPGGPLEKAVHWIKVEKDGRRYARETNTMPQWAGSCWYYLRFCDPKNDRQAWDPAKEKYWMPVDLYVGGAEHAVLHLLYSRFWHKVLFDRGYVSTHGTLSAPGQPRDDSVGHLSDFCGQDRALSARSGLKRAKRCMRRPGRNSREKRKKCPNRAAT